MSTNFTHLHVKKAILKTFAYRSIFSYPLTFHQTYSYLISDSPINFQDFKKAFINLLEDRTIFHKNNLFYVSDLDVMERLKKEEDSKKLLATAIEVSKILKFIPWIKLVSVTGAVAAGNTYKSDDIDVLIVASQDRLWLTRFFTVLMLKILKLYRRDADESGKICPNIFIDEEHLEWEHAKNIYTAHEVLLMKPVFDRKNYYLKFLKANIWVREFLPHVMFDVDDVENFSKGYRLDVLITLEYILMKLQLWYMQKKKTKEITTEQLIHFRRDDHAEWILKSFKERFESLI